MTAESSDIAAETRRRFDRAELAPLWRAARQRFERSHGQVNRLTLRGLTVPQQRALADLLGLPRLPGPAATIRLPRLDAILLASPVSLDTRGVVEAIGGPMADLAAARTADRRDRAELWAWLADHPLVASLPALDGWVAAARTGGIVAGSVTATRALLEQALAVLAALPAGGQSLPAFSDRVCGHAHALDDGTRLAGLVLRALALLRGEPPPTDAGARRRLWELSGVACDAVSTSVLVAGLRPTGDDPLAITLRMWADAGQATSVTLAQLTATTTLDLPAQPVWVVENPSVLTDVLAALGCSCPALVCTSGWPNTAAVQLLRRLAGAGCTLAYHGDLDGEGVRIAAYVLATTGATPWRMSVEDYLAAVPAQGPAAGRVTEAPWDPALTKAMRSVGVAVLEERVINLLLADLKPRDSA